MKYYSIPLLLLMFCVACNTPYQIEKTDKSEYVLSDTTNNTIDSSIYKFIVPYREKVNGAMSEVLGESEVALEKGVPESRLGNFVSDACMREALKIFYPSDGHQPDFAFFNNGGLRRALPKGPVTRGDVFELMPFENELVVITVNGELVKKIFNFIASKDGGPVAGARFQIRDHKAENIYIQAQPLDTTKTYKALTSDYLANGGDSFDFLPGLPRENVNLKVRDAILQYIVTANKAGMKININPDGRISNAQ
jgi:2',3'-cyclic-nucleotide 2'-phosphodiesterase (5'-nucleotidase family)